jgi:lipopolysaccharide/colanic/teichoic acid biosynthesis glycosyltransferase
MRFLSVIYLIAGTIATVVGYGKIHAVWHQYDYTDSLRFGWSLSYIALLLVVAYGFGFPGQIRNWRSGLLSAAGATALAGTAVSMIQLFVGDSLLPRFVVFSSALTLVPWYTACSMLDLRGRHRAEERDRVVVVADRTEAQRLRDDLSNSPERHAYLVDIIRVSQAQSNGVSATPLSERVLQDRASVLVLSREAQIDDTIISQAAGAHESGVRVRTLSGFYEEWLGKLPITELERVSMLFDIGEIHGRRYFRVKRVLDLFIAVCGCLALGALLPVVLVGNIIANRGPLLYRQERIGKNGKIFRILKFRTMRVAGDTLSDEWTSEDDPRITPWGRVLRRMHIDELPQAVNVLRGDLSIVGPRPEQPRYVTWLVERIPFYDFRHLVRPGVTGWAQVKHGYGGCEEDALEKLQYDFYYLRHQSLTLDALVAVRTIRSVVGLGGR